MQDNRPGQCPDIERKLLKRRPATEVTIIFATLVVLLGCTVQPRVQNSYSESPNVDEILSDSIINDSVEATVNAEMAIKATVDAAVSATQTAQETGDCEPSDPDKHGNIVHWCDDGSYWWMDSVTGYRYEMDADGNGITDNPDGYPTPE